MNYTHIENALTDQELEVIDRELMSYNYPWFLHLTDTEDDQGFPFMCHTLMHRNSTNMPLAGVVNSDSFEFFNTIFKRLCPQSTTLLRAAINLTFHNNSTAEVGTIHEDHEFEHNNLIIYLTKSKAGTRLYDNDEVERDRIPGEYNTAVKFQGKHAQEIPASGEARVVAVFTYI